MTAEVLYTALNVDPFRRFIIKMVNGDVYRVGHPKVVTILLDEKSAIVTGDRRILFQVVDIGQITALEFPDDVEWAELLRPNEAVLAEMRRLAERYEK